MLQGQGGEVSSPDSGSDFLGASALTDSAQQASKASGHAETRRYWEMLQSSAELGAKIVHI
jgi:hypothetical protein